ncbi:glycosyltransferase family 2 protein [Sulfitobacter sp. SK011]|uniref:glycosyltransferase family 2 protein n=1 Tax=Sulfitobacter sp. SK011 TaxID=1389004 RepID=UPI000E0C79FD|nr:glycosyltransferase family 2 protein [Sulfitobacter sp. SK011]AXI40672.1 glycosyl transferase family 2 [Sulfitobacter sp. SK011]
MTQLPVSVVIVSRGRPEELQRCLLGVSQLQYSMFEVVVVADPDGVRAAQNMPFADGLKVLSFDEPNISAARNLGLVHAAGEVVAFIDDDAVPEPQWLRYLVAPSAQSYVAAMSGFVRGRNGISYQWKARSLDALGEAHDLDVNMQQASILKPPKGRAIKTEGTNMAFRRSVLIELGGFDPAFHYFLDETDLNMRLASAGHTTAIVPMAEVHHGFAANPMRTKARVPLDLFDIGASWAVFQHKHIAESLHKDQWDRLRRQERHRLLQHMVGGGLEPRDVPRLMRCLDQGYLDGQQRGFEKGTLPKHPAAPFEAFPAGRRKSSFVPTRPMRFKKDYAMAVERTKNGEIVTLLNLSRTAIYHKLKFDRGGIWIQSGGIYGKADRKDSLVCITARARRIAKERARVASQRGLSED